MTDLISRADAIEAVASITMSIHLSDVICDKLLALPSADAVSREVYDKRTQADEEIIDSYRKEFQKALSADAVQGEWNTGKPTKGGKYIVTLIGIGDYRFVDIMHYDKPCMPNIEVSGACWYRDDDEWGDVVYDDKDIIAWIPLPKPYKGGDDE